RKNYERLKILGQNMTKLRNFGLRQEFLGEKVGVGRGVSEDTHRLFANLDPGRNPLIGHTPHGLLVGQLLYDEDSDETDTCVLTYDFKESIAELKDKYDEKAFMSLDGLLRPISINGDGGLPRFADTIDSLGATGEHNNQPNAPEPPVQG